MSEVKLPKKYVREVKKIEKEIEKIEKNLEKNGIIRLTVLPDKKVKRVRSSSEKVIHDAVVKLARKYCSHEAFNICYELIKKLCNEYLPSSVDELLSEVVNNGRSALIALTLLNTRGWKEFEKYLETGEYDEEVVRKVLEQSEGKKSFFSKILRK